MGKTKKDTNVRVAGRREQTKESAAEQMCTDNIPMDLNELGDSSVSDSTQRVNVHVAVIAVEFPNFYRIFLYS